MEFDSDTALLVMDVQEGIVGMLGDEREEYLARVEDAVDTAHNAGIPVFFVVVAFREGYPEVSPNNAMFASVVENDDRPPMTEGSDASQPAIEPTSEDLVVAKKRVSAFAGSDLEMLLRAQGIDNLVLSGIATSGVVLSTLRYAADRDYGLTVLADCCFDRDPEVHDVLLEKVFPKQATVTTSNEWQA